MPFSFLSLSLINMRGGPKDTLEFVPSFSEPLKVAISSPESSTYARACGSFSSNLWLSRHPHQPLLLIAKTRISRFGLEELLNAANFGLFGSGILPVNSLYISVGSLNPENFDCWEFSSVATKCKFLCAGRRGCSILSFLGGNGRGFLNSFWEAKFLGETSSLISFSGSA